MAKARTKIIRSKRNVRRDWLIRLLSLTIAALTMLTGGCGLLRGPALAPFSTHLTEPGEAGACANYFEALDQAILEAGVGDRQARRIHGFPYLRVNRFLASFADQSLSGPALTGWVDRLAALDHEARKAEIANLPASFRKELHSPAGESDLLGAAISCGDHLRHLDLTSAANLKLLRVRAKVPADYSTTKSILGLYPFSSLFVSMGIGHYHSRIRKTFSVRLVELQVSGRLERYIPPTTDSFTAADAAVLVKHASAGPLGIPEFTEEEQNLLFQAFAPIWEVDVNGNYDRIGTPFWDDNPLPGVDIARPRLFTLLSYARFQGHILPQLNYVVWFPERPLQGTFDILGGRLDGLIWRVTLDRHGEPLIYDTIHNCGCYLMFFPTRGLSERNQKSVCAESILVPQHAPDLHDGERLVIRVASRTHYIERIYVDNRPFVGGDITIPLGAYDELRSLPAGAAGRRSLFGPHGIVPGTERRERWLLWTTGVPEPGAMRQWGNHAIAFIGRRHFDDPYLIDRLFIPVGP
jgi:hypothetical protein